MNRKKIISLTIVAMMVLQLFMPANLTFGETGANVSGRIDDSKTETSIKIYNGNEKVEPNIDGDYKGVEKEATIEITSNIFLLNNDGVLVGEEPTPYNYYEGDYFYIDLPESIKFSIPESGIQLRNGDGVLVGMLTLEDSKLKVTFTKYVENKSDIEVEFNIQGEFKEEIVNDNSINQVNLEFMGKTIAEVYFNIEDIDIFLDKDGVINLDDNTITWNIDMTLEEDKIVTGIVLKDTFSNNQTYVDGSLKVNNVTISAITSSAIGFEYAFPDKITGKHIIEYKTQINDSSFSSETGTTDKVKYTNVVWTSLNGKNSEEVKKELYLDWINKTGELADNDTKIKWTVEINNIDKFLDGKAPRIQDTLDSKIILVENNEFPVQIKFDNSQAVTVTTTDSGNGYYSTTGSSLNYYFNSAAPSYNKAVLTYYTDINNPNAYNNNNTTYYNTAELIWSENSKGPSDTAGVGIGKGIIQKISESKFNYYDKHEINWKVYINKNRVSITDAKFTDTLPGGVTYKEGSFKLNGTVVLPTTTGSTIEYAIGNINTPQTITYTTTIKNDYPGLYTNADVSFTNNAQLTGGGIEGGIQKDTSTQVVGNEVISKVVDVNYNYNTRIVKWEIIVNKNEIPLKNVSVTDDIPLGMKFLHGTFNVDGNLIALNANQYVVNGIEDIVNKDSFNYTLGNINEQHVITFETVIKEKYLLQTNLLNKTITFTNSADIAAEGYTNKPSATAKVNVDNSIVKKIGTRLGLDSVKWSVTINNNKLLISDVNISDVLQEGLTLDVTSVELYAAEINDAGVLTKGSKITDTSKYLASYDESTRTFEFKFLNTIHEAYVLEFVTDVLVDYVKIENTIKFSGSGQTASNDSSAVIVNINDWDGSGDASNGSFTINKVNSNNEPLTGAVFEVKDKLNTAYTITELVDGNIVYRSLPYRLYYIEETKAPEGYLLDKTIKIVKVSNASGSAIEIVNQKAVADVELIKKDEKGLPLSGAEFKLFKGEDVVGTPVTSNSNGEISFTDVEPGYYKIVETNSPTGYKQADDIDVEVRISDDGTKTEVVFNGGSVSQEPFIVTNELVDVYGDIVINKTDMDSNPLKGAEFTIYDSQQNDIKTANSDEYGKVEFKNMELGTYTIKETKAPSGYYKSSDVITAKITRNVNLVDADIELIVDKGIVNNVYVVNNSIDFEVKKTDKNDKPLSGAEFTLYDDNDLVAQVVKSNDLGEVKFTKVPIGNYSIKETKAPSGYYLSDTVVGVEVKENKEPEGAEVIITLDEEIVEGIVSFVNDKIPSSVPVLGKIVIKKTDEDGKVIKGAEFTLYDSKGIIVEKGSTDQDGLLAFTEISIGDYEIKETKAPEGYVLSEEEIDVNIKNDDIQTFTFVNIKEEVEVFGEIEIIKTDDDGKMISDAWFNLYDASGTVLKNMKTVNGRVVFENLPLGDYTIKEIQAPKGYELSNEVIFAKVVDDQKITFSFKNKLSETVVTTTMGNILINKVDEDSQPLPGAEFALYNESGEIVRTMTSDENGKVLFDNLPFGKYSVKEINAPEGYELVSQEKVVEITQAKTYNYRFINVLSETLIDDTNVPMGWEEIEDPIIPEGQVTLPDTGSILNTWILLAIGITLILAGAVMIKRKIIG